MPTCLIEGELEMKKAAFVLLLVFSLLATSCSNKTQLIENDSSSVESGSLSMTENSSLTDNSIPNADYSMPNADYSNVDSKSSEKYERLKDDWSNWTNGSLKKARGASINLFESIDDNFSGKPISDTTKFDNGIVSPVLVYNVDVAQSSEKASLYTIVLINDEVCNFTMDDKKSDNGILHFMSEVNKDCYAKINIEDCNLIKGQNKITVVLLVYFPQIGQSSCIHIIRSFKSDVSKKQTSSIISANSANRYEDIVKYTNNSDRSVLGESDNYSFKMNKFESEKRCSHINKDTQIDFRFINSNEKKDNGKKRNVLCA